MKKIIYVFVFSMVLLTSSVFAGGKGVRKPVMEKVGGCGSCLPVCRPGKNSGEKICYSCSGCPEYVVKGKAKK